AWWLVAGVGYVRNSTHLCKHPIRLCGDPGLNYSPHAGIMRRRRYCGRPRPARAFSCLNYMWHPFAVDPGWAIAMAALLGLVVGSWLSVPAHRLPRMMEREWLQQYQEFRPAASGPEPAASAYTLWRPGWHCPSCAA